MCDADKTGRQLKRSSTSQRLTDSCVSTIAVSPALSHHAQTTASDGCASADIKTLFRFNLDQNAIQPRRREGFGPVSLGTKRQTPACSHSGGRAQDKNCFGNLASEYDLEAVSSLVCPGFREVFPAAAAIDTTGASVQHWGTPTDQRHGDFNMIVKGNKKIAATALAGREAVSHDRDASEPRANDVLLGRGRTHIDHPGNKRLQGLVDAQRRIYDDAKSGEKREITTSIVNAIQSNGGRFLKREKTRQMKWIEVSNDIARGKVSHAMRDRRKKPLGAADMQPVGDFQLRP